MGSHETAFLGRLASEVLVPGLLYVWVQDGEAGVTLAVVVPVN